jgi:hypothetical protein
MRTSVSCWSTPPYAVLTAADIAKPKSKKTGHEGRIRRNVGFDHMSPEEYESLVRRFLEATKVGSNCWVHLFLAAEQLGFAKQLAEEVGVVYNMAHIWHKTIPPPRIRKKSGGKSTRWQPCWRRQAGLHATNAHSVWDGAFEYPGGRWHETMKSLDLLCHLIECYTLPGELVVDCFAGSFQTLRACLKTGRRFIGWELDRNRCTVAVKAFTEGVVRPCRVRCTGSCSSRSRRSRNWSWRKRLSPKGDSI